jgi:glycosyltransferase involved in cell wall biosynthesis
MEKGDGRLPVARLLFVFPGQPPTTTPVAPRLVLDLTPLDTPSRPRGIGRYLRELALGLSELPARELAGIDVVALTGVSQLGEPRFSSDLTAFEGSPEMPSPTEADFYRWAWRHRFVAWSAARKLGAAAVHFGDPHATPLLFGLSGAKRIVTCHDLVPTRFPERYFGPKDGGAFVGKRIERRRYRSADRVVAISDATRDDVIRLLGVSPSRVTRVYNAVDVERWARVPSLDAAALLAKHGLAGKRFALYVGGSDWRKNTEGMMGALAHARAAGEDLVLAWAGALDEGHIAGIEEKARAAGVASSFVRLGYVSDDELAVLYREAVAHLFVSRCEGFGLTVVEAMAAGCPVITTTGGSLGEVAGDAALLVDPEIPSAIGAALLRVAREPAFADDLRARGRARAPRFSRAAQALAMAQVYREVIATGLGLSPIPAGSRRFRARRSAATAVRGKRRPPTGLDESPPY